MTGVRGWWPEAGVGLLVLAFGAFELLNTPAGGLTWGVLLLLAVATALHRQRPSVALGLVWFSGVVIVADSASFRWYMLAVAVVAYGTARFGSAPTVWASGFSIPAAYLIGVPYVWQARFDERFPLPEAGRRLGFEIVNGPMPLLIIGAAAATPLVVPWLLGLVLRLRDTSEQNRAMRAVAEQTSREAEAGRDQAVELAELREQQTRLARDVHDVVGHSLAVILAQAEAGSFVPDEDPARLKAALAAIADSARSSLGEVRHVLASTNDGVAVQVREGLEGLVESVRGSGTPVDFMDTGLPVPLGPQAETVAYRVLQEMLTNALRHGVPGQPIDVRRHGEPTGVTVQVANAVAEGEPPNTAGSGIEGMRTRLLGVGGRLSVDRSPRRFLAVAWLPAQESDLTQPIRPVGRP
ncbi:MAG: histidine kinase [Nocardioidaceae bacterium]